ncbi:hypothetical protein F5876DRAFT_42180 [Lentinula aff. lateritia]|uniref:Uncharacterized protein n=1 Tax=Lentinula aff. lateritia TaxID=2804960 RepID=A0ACC1TZJ9_9AGAR|nr:hypothetical protein F5876DRAFT_42180 [Lentinula aff. lateritia]
MAHSTPTNWSIQFLSTVSSDTDPCMVFSFEQGPETVQGSGGGAKYIFNVGENTNRAFTQSKMSWNGTRAVFLTGSPRDRVGGLSSLLMSFADGDPKYPVRVIGPPGLNHLLATQRSFVYRKNISILSTELPFDEFVTERRILEPIFQDGNLTVYGIPITPMYLDVAAAALIASNDLKRKRDSDIIMSDASAPSTPLANLLSTPSFTPETLSTLTPAQAQEWREMMVAIMFPRSRGVELPATASNNSKQSKYAKEEEKEEPDEYRRPMLMTGFHKQLPRFHLSETQKTLPPSALSLSYLAVGPLTRGKFDARKAEELGVPNGPLRGALTRGETVRFKKKKGANPGVVADSDKGERWVTVRPEDVVAPSIPPAAALILDIPTPEYIPSLLDAFREGSAYAECQQSIPKETQFTLHTIIHLIGDGVLEDPRYRAFMAGFERPHHVISSPSYLPDPVTFTSSAYQQLKLAQLDPEMFRVPKFGLEERDTTSIGPQVPLELSKLAEHTTLLTAHTIIPMRPLGPPQKEDWAASADTLHTPLGEEWDRFHPAVAAIRNRLAKAKASGRSLEAGKSISVITLGTGSAVPGKYRNVSATVIQIPEWGNILLDCGEGTWGQLCRMFGTASSTHTPTTSTSLSQSPGEQILGVDAFLHSLKLIYISHLHADHHLGLAKILAMRQALSPPPKDPVYLVGVRGVHLYLREVCDLERLGIEGVDVDRGKGNGVITVLSPALHWNYSQSYTPQGMWSLGGTEEWLDSKTSRTHITALCRALNLHSFTTVDVRHRTRCYGCIIHSKDGWSIVFSGDTMPSDHLVDAAKNITLLIHEATMSDAQADMAAAKAHSTVGQAIDIGRRMGAENVLLTHFSARQPKMPHRVFVGGTPSSFFPLSPKPTPYIATAFDYAHFTLGSMWKMQFYMDGIEQSYREMVEEERDTVEEKMVEEEWEEIREQEDMRVKEDERESWMMGGYEQEFGMELGMDIGEETEAEQMESDREVKQIELCEEDEKTNDYP